MEERKRKIMRRIAVISAIVAAAGLGGAAVLWLTQGANLGAARRWEGAGIEERESLPAESIEEILIDTASADVAVLQPEDPSRLTIEVRLTGVAPRRDRDQSRLLQVEREGAALKIEAEPMELFDLSLDSLGPRRLRLEVTVPSEFSGRLRVKTASGDVGIRDRQVRELAVRTVSGDVELASIRADTVALGTISGEARVEGLETRAAALSTVSGDFELTGFSGSLEAESTSGSLQIGFSELLGDVEAESTSGEVDLTLPRTAEFRLEARSTSGDVACRFPIELTGADTRAERNSIVGTVGGGDHRVVVRTVSGDIRVAY